MSSGGATTPIFLSVPERLGAFIQRHQIPEGIVSKELNIEIQDLRNFIAPDPKTATKSLPFSVSICFLYVFLFILSYSEWDSFYHSLKIGSLNGFPTLLSALW